MIENKKLRVKLGENGGVAGLWLKDDIYKMNWVMDQDYLHDAGYKDDDKMFGYYDITVNGEKKNSQSICPVIKKDNQKVLVTHDFEDVKIEMLYDLEQNDEELHWNIILHNKTDKRITVDEFGIWISFAYVMFRDKNVLRNIHESAAVFPSISKNYTKLNIVRRDGKNGNIGMYQTKGETNSVGTYCDYVNLFFENVSPSLDGMLFHKLYLAGGYPKDFKNADWIYSKEGFCLEPNGNRIWDTLILSLSKKELYF